MTEDIHNNDDLFRKAYQHFEEEPSPEVWDKLNAQLDKKDAIYYRSRFARWRNIAVMLLLLLGAVVTYELIVYNASKQDAGIVMKKNEEKQNSKETVGCYQRSQE